MNPGSGCASGSRPTALAERIADDEHPIYLWITSLAGQDPSARPESGESMISFRPFAIPWVEDIGSNLLVVYDWKRDTLLVDTLGGTHRGVALRPESAAYFVVVDLDTRRAFGSLIPRFLERAIPEVPRLAMALATAEFRPLREEELGGVGDEVLRPAAALSGEGTGRADVSNIKTRPNDIALLSA